MSRVYEVAPAVASVSYVEGDSWLCPRHFADAGGYGRPLRRVKHPCDRCVRVAHQAAVDAGEGWADVEAAVHAAGLSWSEVRS